MYEELTKALRKQAHDLPEKFSRNAENINLFLKAADAIEEQSKPKWVKIESRPMDEEERQYYSERLGYDVEYGDAVIYCCQLPEEKNGGERSMSVFIHNIGIPKTGYVDVRIFSDGRATTQTGDRPFYREMKIEEVPEKHGRLIDADAYKSLLRGIGNREYRRENGTICDAIKFLHPHYAPTVIPAEMEEETCTKN